MAKATIVVPIFDVDKYLRKTIASVIHQTQSDIEIILVDDGSKDSSGAVCDEYASIDKRIKVIHKENGGLSSARNVGTQASTSDYIMFLDGDDYLREDAVELCLRTIKKYPCDFVQFFYKEVCDSEASVGCELRTDIYQAHTSRELFENLYRLGGVAASGATKFMKRELALEMPFENIIHEDEMWCTRAFQRNLTVTYLPEELYYYVMRNGSIIHSSFNMRKLDSFKVCEERLEVLKKLDLMELCGIEYEKMFRKILQLYVEAKSVNNETALKKIKRQFDNHCDSIKKYAKLQHKFKFLLGLMSFRFELIGIYNAYHVLKER